MNHKSEPFSDAELQAMQGAMLEHQLREFPKSQAAEIRSVFERELRLAKEYWLEMQPFVKGRILRGVEFFVARHAYRNLEEALEKVTKWNRLCDVTRDGSRIKVSVDVDLSADDFREPELPKMLFADNVKPEILAAIAAPLSKEASILNPTEAIRTAHELLMAAERYIGTLPKQKQGTESLIADLDLGLSTVTLTEIFESNKEEPGRLPLLPPHQFKRKGKSDKEILDEPPLSIKAIKDAVRKAREEADRKYSSEHSISKIQEDAEQENDAVGMLLENITEHLPKDRISLEFLCTMRWERFKTFWLGQQKRVLKRETNKNGAPKTKESKLPKSAATTPKTAGRRQK